MRTAPWHIVKGLHELDEKADVIWDEITHNWVLYWDNQRICGLFHADGTNMLELNLDEIKTILDRSDNFKDGPERVRRMRSNAAEAKSRANLEHERMIENSCRESEKMVRRKFQGAPIQVSMA